MRNNLKVAILSNINLGSVLKEVGKSYEVLGTVGYGNLFEMMLDPTSAYNQFDAEVTIIIVDIWEMTKAATEHKEVFTIIDEWFDTLKGAMEKYKTYFISDIDYRGVEGEIVPYGNLDIEEIEWYWRKKTKEICETKGILTFEYKKLVRKLGQREFYSSKMWYLGKIPYSNKAQRLIAEGILQQLHSYTNPLKKLLLLDLDCTLWGGIVGEDGIEGIGLSEDGIGGIYKDFQRCIKQFKTYGILLGIVSKNNEKDAIQVISEHPHMILKSEDFIVTRINWEPKYKNIVEIANVLNIGLDSIVFIDDNPTEREEVRNFLPQVKVPEFPEQVELLPEWIKQLFIQYFKSLTLTSEDKVKTEQYKVNFKREEIKKTTKSFEEFLERLEIKVKSFKNQKNHLQRIYQLVGKTNQFNLTSKRYSLQEVERMIEEEIFDVHSFSVEDRFGDYGIVSVIIVDKRDSVPVIDTFLMSCRVMSKAIENYFLHKVEEDLLNQGYEIVKGVYIKSEKNAPVEDFYLNNGYEIINQGEYIISLTTRPKRKYIVSEG